MGLTPRSGHKYASSSGDRLPVAESRSRRRLDHRDQPRRTLVHLLNLNIERVSSFQDKVRSANDIQVSVRVPFAEVRSVRALTADSDATAGALKFTTERDGAETIVRVVVPRLEIATLLVCEP